MKRLLSRSECSPGKQVEQALCREVLVYFSGGAGHGDAAFADYVWLASYSRRFGGPQSH